MISQVLERSSPDAKKGCVGFTALLFTLLPFFFFYLADLAPGWQEGKHSEHALSVTFQHRDRSADHL